MQSRIAIDASRAFRARKTGIEWYAWHLLHAMKKQAPPNWQVSLLVDGDVPQEEKDFFGEWKTQTLNWPPRFLWSQLRLSAYLQRHRPDLFFSPAHVLPFFATSPAALTLHDVEFMQFPEAYSKKGYAYLKLTTQWATKHATKIFTPSAYSKKRILHFFACDPEKIVVTPLASTLQIFPEDKEKMQSLLSRVGVSDVPYLIFLGRFEAKKNALGIVRAFREARKQIPDLHFVHVGGLGRGYEEPLALLEAKDLKPFVHRVGYASAEDLCVLLRNANVLFFPSIAEGFGLPVLDAFSVGTPVITSKGIATEEVAGGAALLVDPTSLEEMTTALVRVVTDEEFQNSLRAKGFFRAKYFSWEKTAGKTLETFEEMLRKK